MGYFYEISEGREQDKRKKPRGRTKIRSGNGERRNFSYL